MPASEAFAGFGTLMQIGDGGGTEVFTTIAEVRDITLPNQTRDTIDVSHMTSPGFWEEVIVGMKRSGELSFDMNWVPTLTLHGDAGLYGDFDDGTKRNFKVILNNTGQSEINFSGYVTGFGGNAPLNDAVRAAITIKVTGAIAIVP